MFLWQRQNQKDWGKASNSTLCLGCFPCTQSQSRSDCPPLNVYKAKEKGRVIVNLRRIFGTEWYNFFFFQKRTAVRIIYASCNLSLLFYTPLHKWWWISFCAEESPEGWLRAGEVRTARELMWYWIDKSEEGRVFSIYTLMPGEKTKWNPSQPSGLLMIGSAKNEAWSCNKCSGARRLALAVPSFPQMAKVTIWWIILLQGAWQCPYFLFVSQNVFQSQNPQHYHVVSVLNRKNLSYTASVFECGRAEVHVCVIWS